MNISGIDKAVVLMALYNHARPQGMGLLIFNPAPMSIEEARKILATGQRYFDYLRGRILKVDLSQDFLDTRLYNRDNGPNAAENAILEILDELTRP